MSTKNEERKLQRRNGNVKSNKKSDTPVSKAKQQQIATNYAVNRSKIASGTAKNNQAILNELRADFEDNALPRINNIEQNIQKLDQEFERYDEEEVEPVKSKVEVLIDLFIDISYKLGIELEDEQLEILGLTYEKNTDESEGEDDKDDMERVESDPEPKSERPESDEDTRSSEAKDD